MKPFFQTTSSANMLTIATAPVVRQNRRSSNFELIFKTISLQGKKKMFSPYISMLHAYIVLFGYVYLDEEDMQKMVDVDLSMPLYTPKHTYKEMCVCKCGVCVCVSFNRVESS